MEIRMKHSVKKGKTISSEVCREKNVLMLHVFFRNITNMWLKLYNCFDSMMKLTPLLLNESSGIWNRP